MLKETIKNNPNDKPLTSKVEKQEIARLNILVSDINQSPLVGQAMAHVLGLFNDNIKFARSLRHSRGQGQA
jgi:hypothetical protein